MQLVTSARVVAVRALLVSVAIHAAVLWGLGFERPKPQRATPPVVNFELSVWGAVESGLDNPSPRIDAEEGALPSDSLPGSPAGMDFDDLWSEYQKEEAGRTALSQRRRRLLSDLPEEELQRLLGGSRARMARRLMANSDLDSPATRYLNRWQRSVESSAALHLPLDMSTVRGALTVRVVIDSEGRLLEAEILEPSANHRLNQLAMEVLQLAAPFASFQDALRRHADEVEVVRRWHFLGDGASGPHLVSPGGTSKAPWSI